MFRFSHISRQRLNTCHEDLIVLFNTVIRNYDCSILCGHRGELEQNEAFDNGYSQLRWPESKHNLIPSNAVDAVPYEMNHVDFNKIQSAFFAGFVLGIANELYYAGTIGHKIRCGIDWNLNNDINDTTFWDAGHFEIIDQ